jgi:hypothetical protein
VRQMPAGDTAGIPGGKRISIKHVYIPATNILRIRR